MNELQIGGHHLFYALAGRQDFFQALGCQLLPQGGGHRRGWLQDTPESFSFNPEQFYGLRNATRTCRVNVSLADHSLLETQDVPTA